MILIIKLICLLCLTLNSAHKLNFKEEYIQGRLPYHLSIRTKYPNKTYKSCSGVVLNSSFILTSADCVNSVQPKDIRVHIRDEVDNIRIKINQIKQHEEFNPQTMCNNIALLKVDTKIGFTRWIQPIRLPTENVHFDGSNKLDSNNEGQENVRFFTLMTIYKYFSICVC